MSRRRSVSPMPSIALPLAPPSQGAPSTTPSKTPSSPPGTTTALFSSRSIGFLLLLLVNILWVLSSELMRFVFDNDGFRRPYFCVYFKMSLLSVYFARYLFCSSKNKKKYKKLSTDDSEEVVEALRMEGFEPLSCAEEEALEEGCSARSPSFRLLPGSTVSSTAEDTPEFGGDESEEAAAERTRRVRFSSFREVRRLPEAEAAEARAARRSFRYSWDACSSISMPRVSIQAKYAVLLFAPLWLVCSFTYHAALMFTSVSSLNLLSASSSLFVLVISLCFPSKRATFTCGKALLVALNLSGVALVSEFEAPLPGVVLALASAVAYAVYLTCYARFCDKHGDVDSFLMFGSIGIISATVGSVGLIVVDSVGIERLYPLPTPRDWGLLVASAVIGTLCADLLWLVAAKLTDSLSASLSLSLAIPLSFAADFLFRAMVPSVVQMIAAVPITISFIGVALLEHAEKQGDISTTKSSSASLTSSPSSDDRQQLLGNETDDEDDESERL